MDAFQIDRAWRVFLVTGMVSFRIARSLDVICSEDARAVVRMSAERMEGSYLVGSTWSCFILGLYWVLLGRLGAVLGRSWAVLGRSWAVLGRSWAVLGRSWGGLGAILGRSRSFLGLKNIYFLCVFNDF